MDYIGIGAFLGITFAITWLIEGLLLASGFRITDRPALHGQLLLAAVMWVPALAAWLTVRFITKEGVQVLNLHVSSWRPYAVSFLIVPIAFALIYLLTYLLGLGRPDWRMSELRAMIGPGAKLPSIGMMFLASLFAGGTMNALFALGEEIGWRGYLLPKLLPLGRPMAYLVVGVIWGLWHAPMILAGFNYPGKPVKGVFAMMGVAITLGMFINDATLKYNDTLLAGWIHGMFNGQAYGIWRVSFPGVNPLLGGFTGVVSMAVFILVGIIGRLVI